MKKTVYIFELLLQGVMLVISLINIIYNFLKITQAVFIREVFPGSIYLFFVPYNRYIDEGNVFEILILFVFFIISFGLYFCSARELLDDKNIIYPFTIINFLWFNFSATVPMFIAMIDKEYFIKVFTEKNFLSIFFRLL